MRMVHRHSARIEPGSGGGGREDKEVYLRNNFCLQPRLVLYQSLKTNLLLVLWILGEFVADCKEECGGEY